MHAYTYICIYLLGGDEKLQVVKILMQHECMLCNNMLQVVNGRSSPVCKLEDFGERSPPHIDLMKNPAQAIEEIWFGLSLG